MNGEVAVDVRLCSGNLESEGYQAGEGFDIRDVGASIMAVGTNGYSHQAVGS